MTPPPSPADVPTNLRLPQAMLDRADRVAARVAADPRVGAFTGKPSRSAVLRRAIEIGLAQLEQEFPEPG